MTNCFLCQKNIDAGKAAVSIVGGQYPIEDPDFFMVDEEVLREAHAHFECWIQTLPKRTK
jgi:hypothetical protein